MVRLTIRRPSGGFKAFILAVMVHAALVALLVVGFRWQAAPLAPPPSEKIVQAKTLNEPEVNQEIERLKKQEERQRRAEAEKQRREDVAKKKAEAAKQAEAEKQRKADEQKALDAKRKLEEDKKRKTEAEKKHKVDEQQKLADAKKAKGRKLEDEARRKDNERALKEQLAAEEKARQQQRRQAEQAQQAMSEIDKYRALIKQKVERNWARPPSAEKGLECLVRVRLIQSGEVIQAKVVRSSGNAAFDRSVENAVYKASPLPLPEDKSLFGDFRELEFIFKPED
jgi:colicin import membrane protein